MAENVLLREMAYRPGFLGAWRRWVPGNRYLLCWRCPVGGRGIANGACSELLTHGVVGRHMIRPWNPWEVFHGTFAWEGCDDESPVVILFCATPHLPVPVAVRGCSYFCPGPAFVWASGLSLGRLCALWDCTLLCVAPVLRPTPSATFATCSVLENLMVRDLLHLIIFLLPLVFAYVSGVCPCACFLSVLFVRVCVCLPFLVSFRVHASCVLCVRVCTSAVACFFQYACVLCVYLCP